MSTNNQDNKPEAGGPKFQSYWLYAIMSLVLLALVISSLGTGSTPEIDKTRLYQMLEDRGAIVKIDLVNGRTAEIYIDDAKKGEGGPYQDAAAKGLGGAGYDYLLQVSDAGVFSDFLKEAQDNLEIPFKERVRVNPVNRTNYLGEALQWLLPLGIIILIWVFLMRRIGGGAGGPGGQIFNIGKSKATLFDQNSKVNITFADVAGLDEAKEEVIEVVDFLKNPKKYTALGGKIPKGVLLVGPPGTGKTLLAKAVAGEAGVPFFTMSGSDFVEMFVGVGASRVRDLFKQAREKAPCIIFIDEIDAIGRARGKGNMQGGNDERENTLNQLLVEMDGFSTDKGVILMAATNRPDVLDSALLRPGRFDRQIGIDNPDLKGREAIFKVHLKTIKIDPNTVDAFTLAEMTPGFAGADIANICNEAALIAARRNQDSVTLDDFNYALDKVIGGLEKKNKLIHPDEKKIIAYHEAGHAICGWYLEHASPLVKVTIVPRGVAALGYAQYLPKEQYITRTEQMLDMMCMTFGGRAAEQVVFSKISTGAQNDLDKVTKMAYDMTTVYGMNPEVGQVSFYGMSRDSYTRPYSDETATLIDTQVRIMLDQQYQRAIDLLTEKREQMELLATELLDKEVLSRKDLERLIGPRPHDTEVEPQEWAGVIDNAHDPNSNGVVTP
ncbi:ATP-dependent zinc metalloprotease FtsH [Neolewinella lacunae]|uniref:ATP-dependent zinc metalloprotease FtsH n=1 Tax=Neolewinella lacunae TaxID=1517758 RepID=A0A923PLH9_9BACT|nr:ATP-dependent zinc metalloprotease FtsH [Neolewinella lacunae]MBC6995609.1 ATP-dependent zinc metalloprotease FtsH [Neolewinella lacunae]MDN3635645.1 ATP-dependent zinc metalloprotease FtsH [Neolewinella lacunae]